MAKKKPVPPFDPVLLDALAADLRTPADLDALFRQMKKALVPSDRTPAAGGCCLLIPVSTRGWSAPSRSP